MPLGLQAAYGFAGARQSLDELLQRRVLAAKQAQIERQQQIENAQRERQIGQGDRRIGLDEADLGFRREVRTEDAPIREAGRLYTVAQTGELQRKPEAEREARTFQTEREKTAHGYRLGEIGATGEQARRTKQTAEPPEPGAGKPGPYALETARRTIEAVDQVLPKISNLTAGVGSILSRVPGSSAANVSAELSSVASNVAFKALQAMREASKTGGALGQVSERELDLLSAVEGSIRQNQSPANLRKNLLLVKGSMERFRNAAELASPSRTGAPGPGADTDMNRVDELLRKYGGQ